MHSWFSGRYFVSSPPPLPHISLTSRNELYFPFHSKCNGCALNDILYVRERMRGYFYCVNSIAPLPALIKLGKNSQHDVLTVYFAFISLRVRCFPGMVRQTIAPVIDAVLRQRNDASCAIRCALEAHYNRIVIETVQYFIV